MVSAIFPYFNQFLPSSGGHATEAAHTAPHEGPGEAQVQRRRVRRRRQGEAEVLGHALGGGGSEDSKNGWVQLVP